MSTVQEIESAVQTLSEDEYGLIYFKAQVDAGLRELDEGMGIPHEVVEKRKAIAFND